MECLRASLQGLLKSVATKRSFFWLFSSAVILLHLLPKWVRFIGSTLMYFFSFFQLYSVREFLSCRPAVAKTAIHDLLKTTSTIYQLFIGIFYIINCFCTIVPDTVTWFIDTYPTEACNLINTRSIGIFFMLHILALAAMKLVMTACSNFFLSLDQDLVSTRSNVLIAVLTCVLWIAESMPAGSICDANHSSALLSMFGALTIEPGKFGDEDSNGWKALINLVVLALAFTMFLTASIWSRQKEKKHMPKRHPMNILNRKKNTVEPGNEIVKVERIVPVDHQAMKVAIMIFILMLVFGTLYAATYVGMIDHLSQLNSWIPWAVSKLFSDIFCMYIFLFHEGVYSMAKRRFKNFVVFYFGFN